jgi:YVTN family beta-propeller protein
LHAARNADDARAWDDRTVQEISLASNMVMKTGSVGGLPGYIALLPDGKRAYFVRPDGNTVEVLDTATVTIASTITVETTPSTLAVCHGASMN